MEDPPLTAPRVGLGWEMEEGLNREREKETQ